MSDRTDDRSDSMEEKVERHADGLQHGSQDNSRAVEDEDSARIAARRILEESEEPRPPSAVHTTTRATT